MAQRPLQILLVEDDEVDAEQLLRALRQHQLPNPVRHVIDGVDALHALRGTGGYARLPQPYLILLDIHMPRMNGLEFLQALRRDAELKRSVVFVLTTAPLEAEMLAAYQAQIAGYLLKNKVNAAFLDFIKLLNLYPVMVERTA